MQSVTLKSRIIIIVTIFTIVLVGVFIFIQLAHELDRINESKSYQASLTSYLFRSHWQSLTQSPLEEKDIILSLIERGQILENADFVEKIYIFDKDGNPLAHSELIEDILTRSQRLELIRRIERGEITEQEEIVDKEKKIFSIYLPLREKGELKFIAGLFFSLADIWQAFARVYRPAFSVGMLLVIVNVIMATFLSRLVVNPIRVFNRAAHRIASGDLDLRVKILTGDELEEMAQSFNHMAKRLKIMKEKAENVNPLTKLPGNIVIMEEVEKRIKSSEKFIVIYCDLDNFKAFNDKYGIHAGDEAIQLTGRIFKEALEKKGDKEDFIGHEGGDDFLILTSFEKGKAIAAYIISEFDKRIRGLYDNQDLERGYIEAKARDGLLSKFPIMTISLAGATNQFREIKSYAKVTNIAAEVKKKAKSYPRSCFVIDKRKG